jgi:hypothetical protein
MNGLSADRQTSAERLPSSGSSSGSSGGSSSSSSVPAQAVVFAARAMKIQGQLLADMVQLQEGNNNQNRATRDIVVLQEHIIKDADEAADLMSNVAFAYKQQQTGSSSSSSSGSSGYMADITQLQMSWKSAVVIWEQGAELAAAANIRGDLAMLSTQLVRKLAQQQTAVGDVLCAELAVTGLSNNPSCGALGKSNEARVITSTCSRCKTAS